MGLDVSLLGVKSTLFKVAQDGGDGGKGGNVYFQVDANTHTLSHFHRNQHLKAKNGEQGMGRKMYGKSGEHLVIIVPPGTQVIDAQSGEILLDLLEEGEKKLFYKEAWEGLVIRILRAPPINVPNTHNQVAQANQKWCA